MIQSGVILQAPPTRPPARASMFARAWICQHPDEAEAPATVVTWLVNYRPEGAYWMLGAIALDPARGYDRRRLQFPEATHEIAIYAIALDWPLPDVNRWEGVEYIEPAEVRHQIELHHGNRGDLAAAAIVRNMVMSIVQLGRAPMKINRRWWDRAIDRSAEDFREGLR